MSSQPVSSLFSICVFCGSRPGGKPEYEAAATEVGEMIADEGWRLVYGAGDVGLMGAVARAAQAKGAATFGVIPTHLLPKEVGKRDLTTFIVTENMHERKKVMFMNCDAIVVLPGGAGSLDEFFEVLTWKQIGLHDKPIFLLSTEGYWKPLEALIEHVIDEGFAPLSTAQYYETVQTVGELAEALRTARTDAGH
ncbi:TIGR00730 family Rossman fold protein [Celeribacter ethanolicus]|uniref:Cytokinin riboside 5'-monophosphate phosphoribohydrolase n=1 Tax=Celeribacter ethanolicus TaxID=1758178 RepID=A0A291G9I2_9RHOB|nr:TIGR00730 family Rossman fold protein [Celeribacter ethanolicus]ATG46666.1 Rossman fold protein, TIGR00730 family [Celeribacter ethanolicus]